MIPTWFPAAAVMNVIEYLNVNITLYYNISYMHRNKECQLQLDPQNHDACIMFLYILLLCWGCPAAAAGQYTVIAPTSNRI